LLSIHTGIGFPYLKITPVLLISTSDVKIIIKQLLYKVQGSTSNVADKTRNFS